MSSIRRLAEHGAAVTLTSFLVVSSARAEAAPADLQELAERWRNREPIRAEELRRTLAERHGSELPGRLARLRGTLERPAERLSTLAPALGHFHAGGLAPVEPEPLNPLLDPLGLFEDEAGEEPPVGVVPRLFLADFDGDGDLDAFVGDKYGYVRYLENTAGPGEEPVYVEATGAASPTGSLDLSKDGDGGTPFGPSAPALADLDGDGDLDLFVGQGYDDDDGGTGRVLYFENVGGTLTRNDGANPFAGHELGTGGATPTFVDIDQDGDLDAFVGTKLVSSSVDGGEVFFFENQGDDENPVLVDRTDVPGVDPFAGENFAPFTAPYFADPDGDGDPDAFVGEFYGIRFFRNESLAPAPVTPVLTEESGVGTPLAGSLPLFGSTVLADVDGDGDLDAFVTEGYGKDSYLGFVQYAENTGTPTDPAMLSTGDRVELVDVDGDGDLDALVSSFGYDPMSESGGLEVWLFENEGTPTEPVWQLQSGPDNPFSTFNATYSSDLGGELLPSLAPTAGDLDGDGLLEAFVGLPDGDLEYLEDDGTGQLDPAPVHPLESVDFEAGPDPMLFDVDGDGELDLVVGHNLYDEMGEEIGNGQVSFFLNTPGPDGIDAVPDLTVDLGPNRIRPSIGLADVDGDGDVDLYVGGYESEGYSTALFLENTAGPGGLAFAAPEPVEVLLPAPVSPTLGDVDGDGQLDVFLGNLAGVEMFLTQAPTLEVTKVVTGGDLVAGGTVEYTVTITNLGDGAQPDDPGSPELTDTLPAELLLSGATVTSGPGTATADTGTNTVRYDGAIGAGETVTIVITADIAADTTDQTVENQATAFVDSDANGTNDAEVPSDDPATDAPDDETAFVVGAQVPGVLEIPTLSQWGAALFAALLSLAGFLGLRRSGG